MSTVGVVIGTYGDRLEWGPCAKNAMASVVRQTRAANECVAIHAETLQQARNRGAEFVADCDWLLFLDADDELDPLYLETMLERPMGDILRPSTLGVYEDGSTDTEAVMIPWKPINEANSIVIGAVCRTELFVQAGGFHDHPILEDWCLWRRLMLDHDAVVCDVPGAVYRVTVRPGSRNTDTTLHSKVYSEIVRGCG